MTLVILGRLGIVRRGSGIIWRGSSGSYPNKVISYIQAWKLVDRCYLTCLAFIHDTDVEPPSMESTLIVWNSIDVFPLDLHGVLLMLPKLHLHFEG